MARLHFANRYRVCGTVGLPVEHFSSNGKVCLNHLCQPRGQGRKSIEFGSGKEPGNEAPTRRPVAMKFVTIRVWAMFLFGAHLQYLGLEEARPDASVARCPSRLRIGL